VIDPGAKREEALESPGDVPFDFLGRHTAVEGGDHDFGNVDGRK
jgi:hypothetical protein